MSQFPGSNTWKPTFVSTLEVPDGTANYTFEVPIKCRLLQVWAAKNSTNGGAGDLITLKNGSDTFCTMKVEGNAHTVSNADILKLSVAYSVLDAGASLVVAANKATNCGCTVMFLVEQL